MPNTQTYGFTSEPKVQGYDPQQGQQFCADYQEIVEQHYMAIWSLVFVCCNRNAAEADDITQDTFLRVLSTRGLEFLGSLHQNQCRVYLRTTAYHLISDRKRADARRREQLVDLQILNDTIPSPERQPLNHLENQELGQEIYRAIAALPERYRFVIVHRILHEWSFEEIAERLNCTPVAVRKRLHRALNNLCSCLEHHDPDPGRRAG